MKRAPRTVSWNELGPEHAATLRGAGELGRLLVTQRGRPSAVLLSLAAFERIERERSILSTLLRGEEDIRRGRTHSWEDVLRRLQKRIRTRSKRMA